MYKELLMNKHNVVSLVAVLMSALSAYSLHASQPLSGNSIELEEVTDRFYEKFDREQERMYKQRLKELKYKHKKPAELYCSMQDLTVLVNATQSTQHELYRREKQAIQRRLLNAINTTVAAVLAQRGLRHEDVNIHVQFSYGQH
jgi:hypothetical protein